MTSTTSIREPVISWAATSSPVALSGRYGSSTRPRSLPRRCWGSIRWVAGGGTSVPSPSSNGPTRKPMLYSGGILGALVLTR